MSDGSVAPDLSRIKPGHTFDPNFNPVRSLLIMSNFVFYWPDSPKFRWTVLPDKPIDPQLVKKLPAFYGTRWFIPAFTTARLLSLFSTSSSLIHHNSWRSILILSSYLRLVFQVGSLTQASRHILPPHQNFVYSSYLTNVRYIPCLNHSLLLNRTHNVW
jgi:hypothetical protein